jgi:hypothetical protein
MSKTTPKISKAACQRVYDMRREAKKAERNEDYNMGEKLWNQAWEILEKAGVTGTEYKAATLHYGIRAARS